MQCKTCSCPFFQNPRLVSLGLIAFLSPAISISLRASYETSNIMASSFISALSPVSHSVIGTYTIRWQMQLPLLCIDSLPLFPTEWLIGIGPTFRIFGIRIAVAGPCIAPRFCRRDWIGLLTVTGMASVPCQCSGSTFLDGSLIQVDCKVGTGPDE
jgi:hypothetical protein